MLGNILEFSGTVIDKLFPDKGEAEKHKLRLLELQQKGELEEIKAKQEIMLEEAKSKDPWTSRARPSFMYVFYIILLCSIPLSILFMVAPGAADAFLIGMSTYFDAIPDKLYDTFLMGYLGYTGARSFEKNKINKKK